MPNSIWSLSLEFQFPIDDSLSYWTTSSLDIEHWTSSYTIIWVEFVRIISGLDIKNLLFIVCINVYQCVPSECICRIHPFTYALCNVHCAVLYQCYGIYLY